MPIATALLSLLQYFEPGPEEHPEAPAVRLHPTAQRLPQQQDLHIAAAPHLPSHSGDDVTADGAAGPTTPDQQAVVSTVRGAGQAETFPGPAHCNLADHQMGPAGGVGSGGSGGEERQPAQQNGGQQWAGTSRGAPSNDDREESASDSTESFDFEQLTPEEQELALQEAAEQLAEDMEGGGEGSSESDSFASEGEETGSGKLPGCCLPYCGRVMSEQHLRGPREQGILYQHSLATWLRWSAASLPPGWV